MAVVLVIRVYSTPRNKYDQTSGRNASAVWSAHLPNSVDENLRYADLYFDPERFAAISPYLRNKKNASATSSYTRWLHFPGDVHSAAQCGTLFCWEMLFVRCEVEEDYQ